MRRLALLLALCASPSGCASGEQVFEVPRTDCEQLRDHLVEVSLLTAAGSNPASERVDRELDKHRQNLKSNFQDDWLHRCQFERDPEWIDCSLGAHDKAALAACNASAIAPKEFP